MRRFLLATVLAAAAFSGTALAVDGELDPSFGTDAEFPGYGFYLNPNGSVNFSLDIIGAVARRDDGKIWAVGKMKSPGAYRLSLYRVGANGYPDTEFGDLGLRTVVGPCTDFTVADATLDSQQRLVVAVNNCADFTVYRFLPNGDLLVLERGVVLVNFAARLVRIKAADVRPGTEMTGEVLFEATGGDLDNMEGLAVHQTAGGETRITLVSDNNFNDWERTLLLEFALPPA